MAARLPTLLDEVAITRASTPLAATAATCATSLRLFHVRVVLSRFLVVGLTASAIAG